LAQSAQDFPGGRLIVNSPKLRGHAMTKDHVYSAFVIVIGLIPVAIVATLVFIK